MTKQAPEYDKRLLARALRRGKMKPEQHEKILKDLPDVKDKAEPLTYVDAVDES